MVHSIGIDGRIIQIERPMFMQGHGKLIGGKYLQEVIQWSWNYHSLHKFYTMQNLPVCWFSFTSVEDWYTKVHKSFWNWNISRPKHFELDTPVCNFLKKKLSKLTMCLIFETYYISLLVGMEKTSVGQSKTLPYNTTCILTH